MNILAFLIGIGVTTLLGWLAVGVAQGRTPVLSLSERLTWGLTLGPTLGMFSVFVAHVAGFTSLDLLGFLAPQFILVTVLGLIGWTRGTLHRRGATAVRGPQKKYPRWMSIGIMLLCVWTTVKLLAGAYDLIQVPTYWDDSFNNWNMRGKMFFVTEELRLEIPAGNGVITKAESVGSYPPTVPLMKTFLAVLRGEWKEPLANGVHLVWFLGLLSVLYCTLRRSFDRFIAAFGVYALVSMPLVMIHGSNPYADIFVSAHVLIAASALLGLRKPVAADEAASWIRLFFLALGLLTLTKNEGLLIHGSLLFVAMILVIARKKRTMPIDHTTIASGLGICLVLLLPWLSFKWMHGLTFGNASSVSGVSLTFSPTVLNAIWFHLTREPNWLLLPLVLPLTLIVAGRRFWRSDEAILGVFILANIALQFSLFTMVQSLATEAVNQTGLSRGLLQIAPTVILTLFFIVRSALGEASRPGRPH